MIRGVAVKVGDPQFTLLWDSDADLDLHVIEPGGKEIYWEEPKGKQGGELDVDNTKGFGPENIYWLVESDGPGSAKVKGPVPLACTSGSSSTGAASAASPNQHTGRCESSTTAKSPSSTASSTR